MLIYWISVCFGMTSFVYAIPRTFVRSKAETFVQTQVQDFSKQDASICLVWNSTRTVRAATFGFDFRRKAAHVPWVISIKYVPRGRRVAARLQGSAAGERETERDEDGGGNDWDSWDGEQLPRYTPLLLLSDHGRGRRSDMGLVETRSVRNLPSYSTLPG
ncbi:hypothetical protein BJ741DRAFT_616516 [Chytriomyces cf. hyalinus JEL632]|nr:hypothetical protein BJ741DRAFT_616516 [Chytriomyces cf. hyalinus JEL632]